MPEKMKIPARNSTAPVRMPGSSVLGSNISSLVYLIIFLITTARILETSCITITARQAVGHLLAGCLPEKCSVKAGLWLPHCFLPHCTELLYTGLHWTALVHNPYQSTPQLLRQEKYSTGVKLSKSY